MPNHEVVDHEEWVARRKAFLEREKELTKLRDELSAARRALPWEKVDEDYVFETVAGRRSLSELFEGRPQLLVYHFMFGPDWDAGCPSCSFWADGYDRNAIHLAQRNITLIAVSRAPLEKIQAYRERMGWSFNWVSSLENDFNWDYDVSFKQEDLDAGKVYYNYTQTSFGSGEGPGLSAFYRDGDGAVFHTYSTFARGLDMFNAAYHMMDMAPLGRDEGELPYAQAWVRRRDEY